MQGCEQVSILLDTSLLQRLQHLPHRFMVLLVLRYTREHFDGSFKCPHGEDIRYRVTTLVSRTEDRVGGARGALGVTEYVVSNMKETIH